MSLSFWTLLQQGGLCLLRDLHKKLLDCYFRLNYVCALLNQGFHSPCTFDLTLWLLAFVFSGKICTHSFIKTTLRSQELGLFARLQSAVMEKCSSDGHVYLWLMSSTMLWYMLKLTALVHKYFCRRLRSGGSQTLSQQWARGERVKDKVPVVILWLCQFSLSSVWII